MSAPLPPPLAAASGGQQHLGATTGTAAIPHKTPAPSRWQHWLAPVLLPAQRWAARRRPRSAQLQLHQGNLYVLPTGAGWMLALTLAVLLVGAINFQLNLGYMLTFWLLGASVVSVAYGHRNLRGLHLQVGHLEPVHAGHTAALPLLLNAQPARARLALSLAAIPPAASHALRPRPKHWAWSHCDVPAGSVHHASLGFVATHRGWHALPAVMLQSRYPLGVCRIWSTWQPTQRLLVYPTPEQPCPPLPSSTSAPELAASGPTQAGTHQREDVRPYQAGDGLRDVLWKKAAQSWATGSGELVVRTGQQAPPAHLWLDAASTGLAEREAQICRLTAWVLQAHAQHARWGMHLPSGQRIARGSGSAHLHACLRALALDGLPPAPPHAPT